MNKDHDIIISELDLKVQAYFDCMLSIEEERRLALMLASLPDEMLTGVRREALAAMSLAAAARKRSGAETKGRKSAGRRTWLLAASAAAVAALLVIPKVWKSGGGDECYAYVGGRLITDSEDITRLMMIQFDDMAEADAQMQISIEEELAEMGTAIDNFYNEIPLNL